jgi:adenosine/AMP kinase
MEFKSVKLSFPEVANIIIGKTHFIKSVEDIYEAIVSTNPNIKFGLAFNEASGKRLVRTEGNDEELIKVAVENALRIKAGHTFVIVMKNGWPINILRALRDVPEVIEILAATANPVEVVVVETDEGAGIVSVIDGYKPLGVEGEADKQERHAFLRQIGYKR